MSKLHVVMSSATSVQDTSACARD